MDCHPDARLSREESDVEVGRKQNESLTRNSDHKPVKAVMLGSGGQLLHGMNTHAGVRDSGDRPTDSVSKSVGLLLIACSHLLPNQFIELPDVFRVSLGQASINFHYGKDFGAADIN